MEEEDVCPICFEEYKNPKLLPCRHSFCANCIDRLVVIKAKNSQFLCPNCRLQIQLPLGGAHTFISNYFIQSWPEQIYCDICGCECQGRRLTCQTCMRKTCPSCFLEHGEEKECNQSDETPEKPGLLYRQLRAKRSNIHTVYEAELQASFQHNHADQIAGMVHSSLRERIWMADNIGNELAEYDHYGTKTKSIPVKGIIIDFCTYLGNALLVTFENSRVVMKVTPSDENVFIRQTHGFPKYVTCMKHGMVAVAINNHVHDKFTLHYYSSEGDRLNEYQHKRFKHISGLCFNEATNQICVSDRKFGYLYMVSPDGTLYRYQGGSLNRFQSIIPLCVTCDMDGNTFLFDEISGFIHIVDQKAKLIALLDTNKGYMFNAKNIAFSCSNQLWISDTRGRHIKVYNIKSCVNYLGSKSDRSVGHRNTREDPNRTCLALNLNGNSLGAIPNSDASDLTPSDIIIQVPAALFENREDVMIEMNEGGIPSGYVRIFVRPDSSSGMENSPLPLPRDKNHH